MVEKKISFYEKILNLCVDRSTDQLISKRN